MALSAKVIHMDERRAEGPQLEDGYIRIANELFDAVLKKLSSYRHTKIVLAIIRKTYGYQKKEDDITISQLAELTGIHRNHVGATVKDLERMRVINPIRSGHHGMMIGINKHHSEWENEPVKARGIAPVARSKSTNLVEIEECNQIGISEQPKQLFDATKTVVQRNQNVAHKRQPQKTTPKERRKPAAQDLPHAPDWIAEKAWTDFVEHRKQIKHPLTSLAAKRVIDKLGQLRADGYCPSKLIDIAIRNGWRDVFPRDEAKSASATSEKPKWMEGVL